jgi:tail protein
MSVYTPYYSSTYGGGEQAVTISPDVGFWTGSLEYDAAGVTINFGATDDNGVTWLWQSISGFDGPDVQGGGVIPKSGDHGAWAAPQFYAARQLTLTVTAMAPSQALRDTARGLMQQAIPVSDLAILVYDEPEPKQIAVRRSGKITEAYSDLCAVTFTAGLVAPDPRKYSVQVSTVTVNASASSGGGLSMPLTMPLTFPGATPSGSLTAVNNGTFETRPVITITGPITSPGLTNVTTGMTVSWTGLVLGAGDALTADFGVRQGLLNGAFRPADLFSAWWNLPPGASTIQLSGNSGGGAAMSCSWRSAWI